MMKKKLLGTALIIAALATFNMSAQEPAVTTGKVCTENAGCHKAAKDKNHSKGHKHGDCTATDCTQAKKGDRKGQRPDFFRGITLTAEQQAQIDSLRPRRPECKADGAACDKAAKAKDAKAKADRKGHDKKFRGPRHHGMNGARKAAYVKKVKEILTPEQYVVFLENIVMGPAQCPDGKGCPADKTGCPEGGSCPDNATK